jgi:hypothetical protein
MGFCIMLFGSVIAGLPDAAIDVHVVTSTLTRVAEDVLGTTVAPEQPLMEARHPVCSAVFAFDHRDGGPAQQKPATWHTALAYCMSTGSE